MNKTKCVLESCQIGRLSAVVDMKYGLWVRQWALLSFIKSLTSALLLQVISTEYDTCICIWQVWCTWAVGIHGGASGGVCDAISRHCELSSMRHYVPRHPSVIGVRSSHSYVPSYSTRRLVDRSRLWRWTTHVCATSIYERLSCHVGYDLFQIVRPAAERATKAPSQHSPRSFCIVTIRVDQRTTFSKIISLRNSRNKLTRKNLHYETCHLCDALFVDANIGDIAGHAIFSELRERIPLLTAATR